jgi:hypothetical protein
LLHLDAVEDYLASEVGVDFLLDNNNREMISELQDAVMEKLGGNKKLPSHVFCDEYRTWVKKSRKGRKVQLNFVDENGEEGLFTLALYETSEECSPFLEKVMKYQTDKEIQKRGRMNLMPMVGNARSAGINNDDNVNDQDVQQETLHFQTLLSYIQTELKADLKPQRGRNASKAREANRATLRELQQVVNRLEGKENLPVSRFCDEYKKWVDNGKELQLHLETGKVWALEVDPEEEEPEKKEDENQDEEKEEE